MKKAALIIFAVAILGAIGAVKAQKQPATSAGLNAPGTSSMSQNMTSNNNGATASTNYKDGTFTGNAADTPYGTVQIAAVISGGKITDIKFLQMPFEEGHSQEITAYAEPYLKQTAIEKQNPQNLDFVTGATSTSYGFQESLQAALNQAANS